MKNIFNLFNGLQPKRERLLIVDDEIQLRNLFQAFFEGRGYQVTTAEGLADAEIKLNAAEFDLVLQDVNLEDGDGIDFLETIQKLQPGIPTIILTGLGYEEDVLQEAVRKGAAGYVSKLLPLDQLLMEVHTVLQTKGKPTSPSETEIEPT